MEIKQNGSQPSGKGPDEYFTGTVRIDPLFEAPEPARARGASVTFQPGARSAWHTHPLGQTLIVTAGTGWIQRWGGPIEEMHKGDVVSIPPGLKHWHGAASNSAMTHIAIQETLDGRNVDWLEKVSDEQYGHWPASTGAAHMKKEPSGAEKMFGGFAPKLVELTDNVLFGDMWERTELSKRDRSLVTVAALIALNRPEQLRFHLPNAVKNGVNEQELLETITHLAFYSGWPNAMSCMAVAKEIFESQGSGPSEKKE